MLVSIISIILFSVFNVQCITMLRGTVVPKQFSYYGDNLDGTELHVRVEDVSLIDAPSTVLSERVIQLTRSNKFPVYFEIVYPRAIIAEGTPEHHLQISASITDKANNRLLYITDEAYFLPRGDNVGNMVTLRVTKLESNILQSRDACNLKPETGMCFAYFEKYFFNTTSQRCEMFVYGGCGGNANRFDTEEDCLVNCAPKVNVNKNKDVACGLSKEVGPCKASVTRYYYDASTNSCNEFIYGGCRGNENNFESYEACLKKCYD